MKETAVRAKVKGLFEEILLKELDKFSGLLLSGDLYGFEETLFESLMSFYNLASEVLMREASQNSLVDSSQRSMAKELGLGKLIQRSATIQLRTGYRVEVKGLYAKAVYSDYGGCRHVLHLWWGVMEGASPSFYSLVGLHAVLCCSYGVARQVLRVMHVKVGFDRMRAIANRVSSQCLGQRTELSLEKGESLEGKRVMISVDGGRARTREYKEETNTAGSHHKFSTPWKEPKLLVITVLDEDGKPQKKNCLPIYDCAFGDDEVMALLKNYLKALGVEKAKLVQVVADGATWIWNRARPMLLALGVEQGRIVELVDYYHAVEQLNDAVKDMPLEDAQKKVKLQTKLKDLLWQGQIQQMKQEVAANLPQWGEEAIEKSLGYFIRNEQRMNYKSVKECKLPCGSGTMESAVRRIICLRFKCPSSFWDLENLEGLIFLRGVLLAGRWQIFMDNLARAA